MKQRTLNIDGGVVRRALLMPRPAWLPAPPRSHEARPAAVVVPVRFGPDPQAIAVLRSRALNDHPGEVAFPGGKLEPTDADLRAAAYREAREEVGLERSELAELGELGQVVVVTGRFSIRPFVAELQARAEPRVASGEVERILELPIVPWLTGERRYHAVRIEWQDRSFLLPHFELGDPVLYGASAVIFFELLARLSVALDVALPEPLITTRFPWGERYT